MQAHDNVAARDALNATSVERVHNQGYLSSQFWQKAVKYVAHTKTDNSQYAGCMHAHLLSVMVELMPQKYLILPGKCQMHQGHF